MKPQKFIIYGNEILLGRVSYHKELLPDKPNYRLIFGGGLFKIDHEEKTITLYGESMDFGKYCQEKLKECSFPSNLKDYSVRNSRED